MTAPLAVITTVTSTGTTTTRYTTSTAGRTITTTTRQPPPPIDDTRYQSLVQTEQSRNEPVASPGARPDETVITPPPATASNSDADALFLFWDEIAYPLLGDVVEAFDEFNSYARPVYKQVRYALPLTGVEVSVAFLGQLYDDRRNPSLDLVQRVSRAVIVGAEAGFTDLASDVVGAVGAAAGGSVGATLGGGGAAPGAGLGYLLSAYGTSTVMDWVWSETNRSVMPLWGLGDWP